jgi:NADPH-ferrihemoprotein reductase
MASPLDLLIVFLTIALPLAFYYRDSLPIIGSKSATLSSSSNGHAAPKRREEEGDPRDFVGKMERAVRPFTSFPTTILMT